MVQEKKKSWLDEVTLMRGVLAILIVFVHAFTVYDGSWREPVGFVDIPVYKWLSRTSFAFTLEGFVFISGYLFAFQRITLNRTGGGKKLVVSKLKRLILPSIVFSLAYFLIFYQYNGFGKACYDIVNGCGHMWYLPMLFWCFIGGWLLEQIKVRDGIKLTVLVIANLLSFVNLPFRLANAAQYMFYFYLGFVIYKYAGVIKEWITGEKLIIGWIFFVIVFVLLRPLPDYLDSEKISFVLSGRMIVITKKASQLIYASSGLLVFYATAVYYTQRHQLSLFAVKLATCSFGIYLFQQFVLQLIYYKTGFPLVVGPYWLPWCGFIIASLVSYLLSLMLLKTKTGRFLIG